jgi:hypothetical protein
MGQVFFNNLENKQFSENWIGLQSIDSGNAFSGIYFSKTDSITPYGLGIEQSFPIDVINKNTIVVFKGYVKSNNVNNDALYVITLVDDNNSTLLWKGIGLSSVMYEKDNWYQFMDSIIIPANLTERTKLKAYLWNQNKKSITSIDDLEIEFKPLINPSFIPDLNPLTGQNTTSTHPIYSNDYYSVLFDPTFGLLKFGDNNDEIVINSLDYYSEREIKGKKKTSLASWKYLGEKKNNQRYELNFKSKVKGSKIRLTIICYDTSQRVEFIVGDTYNRNQYVTRESLVINYTNPVTEVYRNNRKIDTANFQPEYWLDNEGVQIGKGEGSILMYHNPEVSSLQLDNVNHRLYVNLDYEKDHPFFRFPLNPDSNNWKKEESASKYHRKDKREYRFNITIGSNAGTIPRFMKNPGGYLATYIWTEHADFSDIRTNRAVYFGSETISYADSSTGGFVYYDIPVTKSVFYDNPDSISNLDASNGTFNSLESTILTDSNFLDFLNQISARGHDICLHTPEQYTTTIPRLKEALSFMQKEYGSPTWIDHGNNNGPHNNREDLVCDATLKNSPFYSIDLWKNYGIKYLHNAYYEELNTFRNWQFDGSLEKPYSGYGDFFPKPDYFTHPTYSYNLYHWTTTSALFVPNGSLWNYLFNEEKLTGMINNRYVEINHTYPAWVDPMKGMWTYNADSIIVEQPGFNTALANMARLRDEGKLNICTIKDFLNYRTAIDKIKYELLNNGNIRIINNNDFDISDLTMVINTKKVLVGEIEPDQKTVDNETVFWFDIKAGESKVIYIKE